MKEFKHHNKLHGKRQIVKNKILKEFFRRYKDPKMRTLSNPFNITPVQEFMLQTKVEKTEYIPNTSIPMRKQKSVSGYLNINLNDLVKSKSKINTQSSGVAKLKTMKIKVILEN